MPIIDGSSSVEQEQTRVEGLQRLATRPDWLTAALQPDLVLRALARHVPEVASGALRLIDCVTPRLFLKDPSGRWRGTYHLTVEGLPGTPRQAIPLRVTLSAPGLPPPRGMEQPSSRPFAAEGWRCYLPELHLDCELAPPEQALEVLPQLTDPEEARVLLERSIRASALAYSDIRIRACRPEVLNYKPGSRCTIRYYLEYAAADVGRGWPTTVIAKTYDDRTGEQAYQGMAALWHSPLAGSDVVGIAEPLAYVPGLKLLVQTALDEEQTLHELLLSVLQAGTPEAFARLHHFVQAAATGLVELHQSGARAEETITWDERITEIPDLLERLGVVAPHLTRIVTPLVAELQAIAVAHPTETLAPSHGSFDAEQVLLAGAKVNFIDFDSFCMAEPALDVAHFRAALMDSGMQMIDAPTLNHPEHCQAYLQRLDALAAIFLAQYEALAPISRERLALWEALDYLRDALHLWKKPRLLGAEGVIRILEYHLRSMGLLA